ncbi:electron transfer flavoprotein subunit beta/FixA family protein [Schleiferia thermophila]|uniref:Electron transfer flavoprotein subunit beta n=1 Tax=Schleiferia thermophila TaxID=884107 RepID=A0A369A1T7_9FLAO|nr:electron transfer flavoprotein subunit beta/FixA family protein [Schleiferia thermophila]RCX02037.1 electron transfer flavoprotein beta subunit [Schleiferia thermophila]GCD80560.1 electron transfer flavoprotein subunit alpha [Schleiferia thermophila]
MKVLVCISHVPDTTSKINFTNNNTEFDKSGITFIINPYDEFGLTRAIWLQEKQGAHITVINVGTSETEPTLRKALAIGANDAIRIDAEPTDAWFVASQIAAQAKEGGYDLIIGGRESIDYNGSQVPGMVAAMLGVPFVNACVGLEVDGGKATVIREIDGGKEKSIISLPAVIAGQKGLVEESDLRIPNMRGIMQARTKPLKVVAPVESERKTKAVLFEKPASKASVKLVDPDNIEELVRLLHEEAKVI